MITFFKMFHCWISYITSFDMFTNIIFFLGFPTYFHQLILLAWFWLIKKIPVLFCINPTTYTSIWMDKMKISRHLAQN